MEILVITILLPFNLCTLTVFILDTDLSNKTYICPLTHLKEETLLLTTQFLRQAYSSMKSRKRAEQVVRMGE